MFIHSRYHTSRDVSDQWTIYGRQPREIYYVPRENIGAGLSCYEPWRSISMLGLTQLQDFAGFRPVKANSLKEHLCTIQRCPGTRQSLSRSPYVLRRYTFE